jgi:membrane-associated PAP2 superfamily phosphatase
MSAPKVALTRAARVVLRIGILGIMFTLALELFTDTDLALQDHLFNFQTGQWMVDPLARAPRFWFYTFPKLVLFPAGGLLLLAFFVAPLRAKLRLSQRETLYLFCCIAGIPLLAGTGKNLTHVHCPSELARYGGTEEYAKVIARYRPPWKKVPPHCFPAGHASGGFALFGLYFLRRRPVWLLPGMAVGWTMGLYQMLKGAHFLSHTLMTMFLALAFSAGLSCILESRPAISEVAEN